MDTNLSFLLVGFEAHYHKGERMEPVVSITVVTLNKADMARRCLMSILQYTDVPFDITIVDNGSTDYLAKLLTQKARSHDGYEKETLVIEEAAREINDNFCGMKVIRLPENKYICHATNLGFQDRKGKYFAFIPSDTIMSDGYMSKLLAAMDRHKLEGISPRWFESKNLPALQSPDIVDPMKWTTDWAEEFKHGRVPNPYNMAERQKQREDLEPNWMVGIFWMTKREVWEKVGTWDEQFLLTCMDNDYAWRCMILGYKIGIVNDVWIYHAGPVTRMDDKQNPGYHQIGDEDYQKFITKWGTNIDDISFLYHLIKEGKIRKKSSEDAPDSGIPEEIKNKRIAI